jgi:hypothetical protein
MEINEIMKRLNSLGFVDSGKKGLGGNSRIIHPKISKGSLYINNQYVSSTGKYAGIRNNVIQSTLDHKGYPEWRDDNIKKLIK